MKSQTDNEDPKNESKEKSQIKKKKIVQENNHLGRKRNRNNSINNESSIEKITMEDSQKHQPYSNEQLGQKRIYAKFHKKDKPEIIKLFQKYGKLKILKTRTKKSRCIIVIEFYDIKSSNSIINEKDAIYQKKGWSIEYYKEQKEIIKVEEESEENEKKESENEMEEEKEQEDVLDED